MAEVNPALEQQVFDVPQGQWEPHVHPDHQTDPFGEEWKYRNGDGALLIRSGYRLGSGAAIPLTAPSTSVINARLCAASAELAIVKESA
jgi:hypothetical protein